MTDTRNQLVQEALQIGSRQKHRETDAKKRQDELRLEMLQQEAIADEARLAFERGLNFGKALGADLLCPHCWVTRGNRANLVPLDSDDGIDLFKCGACDCHFEFPS